MAGQTYIRKGYIDSCPGAKSKDAQKPEWKTRYYVLYSSTETNKARLDWFNDEVSYRQSPSVRKTIFVEEIINIGSCNLPGRDHTFQISTLRREEPFLFSARNKQEKKDWMEQLKQVVEHRKKEMPSKQPRGGEDHLGDGVYGNQLWGLDETPKEYAVTVGETASAENCSLNKRERTLQLFSSCMSLVHKEQQDKLLFVWPYKYIRRYGRSKNSFTFEAGRRCASGEGVFILLTPQAEELFLDVQQANDNQNQAEASSHPSIPSLPSRAYGDHYGEIINTHRQQGTAGIPDYTKLNQGSDWSTEGYRPRPPSKPTAGSHPPATAPVPPEPRERTLSSSSRGLPAVPRQARPVQPLPAKGAGQNPKMSEEYSDPVQHQPNDNSYTYSSVPSPMTKPPVMIGTTEYGYAEPVAPQGSSMPAILAQMRIANMDSDIDNEYDRVTLNVMNKDAAGASAEMDMVPEAYGQLYDIGNKRPAPPKSGGDDTYQEVRPVE